MYSFKRKDRLPDAGAYRRVFDRVEARASHKYMLLLARGNGLHHHRLGLVIAKKHVRLAVRRNRIKRTIREFFRQQRDDSPGLDVVVLARDGIDRLDKASLSSILRQQWSKLTQS